MRKKRRDGHWAFSGNDPATENNCSNKSDGILPPRLSSTRQWPGLLITLPVRQWVGRQNALSQWGLCHSSETKCGGGRSRREAGRNCRTAQCPAGGVISGVSASPGIGRISYTRPTHPWWVKFTIQHRKPIRKCAGIVIEGTTRPAAATTWPVIAPCFASTTFGRSTIKFSEGFFQVMLVSAAPFSASSTDKQSESGGEGCLFSSSQQPSSGQCNSSKTQSSVK
jgi:hypothetical protein